VKEKSISVTEAARNFADCLNRSHYQGVTFILLKNGKPFARIIPDGEKHCTGADLAAALGTTSLPSEEAQEWASDLKMARRKLKPPAAKWD
jgi:antitoxin (DNA-binding transcriptional repressor) of toxin-antitoxin stability system